MEKSAVRVVMIDDDEDDFEIVKGLLSRNAYNTYEPIWVNNYAEGLRKLRAGDGDIFLIDYNLGEKTGLQLLEEAEGKNLGKPVIMLTGTDSPEVDLSAMEAGATYFVQKGNLIVDHLLERTIRYAARTAKSFDQIRNLDRLKVEKDSAQAATEAKSLFLANISHEIRTPLAAILGFSDLAIAESPTSGNGEYVEIIRRNAQHLLVLVNDLLDLAKIEAGKYDVSIASTDWRAIIKDVMETLQLSATARDNHLTFIDDATLPQCLETDAHCFRQILVNLISNAIKFAEHGKIEIRVEKGASLRLLVKDSGMGMTAEQQERLFKPFSQCRVDVKKTFGGTGLGLHLSQQIANSLGGRIELMSSTPGVGSTFSLDLPLNWSERSCAPQAVLEQKTESLEGLYILLAEDCEDLQALITHYLKKAGANVTAVDNGKVALARAQEEPFDVILMDIQMPGMNGIEATQNLRGLGLKTPVVALSASAMSIQQKEAIDSGFSDYLTKPVQIKKLIETLARYKHEQAKI